MQLEIETHVHPLSRPASFTFDFLDPNTPG